MDHAAPGLTAAITAFCCALVLLPITVPVNLGTLFLLDIGLAFLAIGFAFFNRFQARRAERDGARPPRWSQALRYVGLALVAAYGGYFVACIRTTDFGLMKLHRALLADIWLCACFVAPVACMFLIGSPWRSFVKGLLIVGAISLLLGETFALSQEISVLAQYGWQPGQDLYLPRWFPFGNHMLGYGVGYGWFGQD